MSEQQDLTPTMQELMAQMARMQAELNTLKARAQVLTEPANQPKVEVSTTRRRLLRQLAGGLVAGLAVAGIGITSPNGAEAKLSSNPTGNGLTGRVGMLVMPPGATVSGTMGGDTTKKVGLLVSGDASFNVGAIAPTVNSAIIASTTGGGSTIVGLSQTGTAIYGKSDANFGVWGISNSSNGVQGESTNGYGVYGTSGGIGVYGYGNEGIRGNGPIGVYGDGNSYGGNSYGVIGKSDNTGVYGEGTNTGVYGYSSAWAGYFQGNVYVSGTLSKAAGSFKIDHPLDPENKYLYHSFVESPDMLNVYNGNVTLDNQGGATVTMPDWFEALNSDFRYQLTSIGTACPNLHIAEKLQDRKFKIAGGQSGQEISWMVTGIRQDAYAKAHRIPVEEDKNDKEKGKYLHPELFGKPEEMSVHPRPVATK